MTKVGIIMGSDSDLTVMQEAEKMMKRFDIPCEVNIVSAHRTPHRMMEYANTASERGLRVIIAGAGGAAHLPGMVAALTLLPVIGVPIQSRFLQGLDSILSILQMPVGVPVATVAINGGTNAGLLAVKMLATADPDLLRKLQDYQDELRESVIAKGDKLLSIGAVAYLDQ